MLTPVQYLQNMLEKAAIHQKKEKFSDRLLKHSAFNVQENKQPLVSSQQQLGEMNPVQGKPLTSAPITEPKPLTQTLSNNPIESTGTNQVHDASANPVRSSTPPKPPTPATTTKIPNVLKVARDTGLADVDGKAYINTEDVALLGKLGFEIGVREYSELEKSGEVLDLYSYLEKYAEVPKSVSSAVDKGEAFSGSFLEDMGYSVPKGYEIKGDLCCPVEKTALLEKESAEKTAKADPNQTILLTGHSGSGKTTLSKLLSEKLNLPLHRVDAQTSWDDLRAHFEKNPELERKALTPGSAENKQYIRDVRKIVHKSLGEINGPAVLEGTQLTTLPANQLKKYKANILVGGNVEQSIAQRLQRTADKAAKKGSPFTPEQLDKKREESRLVADSWHPGMEKFKKIPSVINYNHTEHKIEPLLEQLRTMMNKQAVAAKIPSNQPLLPGMDQWVKKQPFNHAEHLYSKGAIPKGHRDRWVSGALADDLRPKFDKVMETIRNTPSAM